MSEAKNSMLPPATPSGEDVPAHAPDGEDARVAAYVAAVLAGDRDRALGHIREVAAGAPAANLLPTLLATVGAAQRVLGDLWAEHRITVAEEHRGTAISEDVLVWIGANVARDAGKGMLVAVAAVEGELHAFPARMVATYLEARGFDVAFLGSNVAAWSLGERLARLHADALVLSATMALHEDALRTTVSLVRARLGASFPIFVGGGAAPPAGLDEGGVASSLDHLAERLGSIRRNDPEWSGGSDPVAASGRASHDGSAETSDA